MWARKRPRRQLSVGTSSDDSIHDDGPLTGGQCPPLRGVLFVTCEEKREFPGTAWMSTAVAVCGSDVLAALCRFALACPSHASLPPLPATLAPPPLPTAHNDNTGTFTVDSLRHSHNPSSRHSVRHDSISSRHSGEGGSFVCGWVCKDAQAVFDPHHLPRHLPTYPRS